MSDSVIRLEHVTLEMDERLILDDVSFEVKHSETKVIIGPSGAGKSSLLYIILGLWKPTSGRVFIEDIETTDLSERELIPIRRRTAMVFQSNALFDSINVAENVGYFLHEHSKMTPAELKERVAECLEFVNLPNTEELLPEEISGGMKKRVAIARALSFHPEIILFDEPTTGLDPINAKTVTELVMKLKKERSATSVVVTHILRDAFAVGDSLAFMKDGKIIYDGGARELMHNRDPFIQEFVSEVREEANLIMGS
ncbi:MAG TPA: ATP-binding cassette domain-containing protein [Bacteroidota bacterium]|nr:ATP-binding cassette domain-containing protein [Bacteroidota bacterium]